MFSMQQKKEIAEAVEKIILSFNHPEMPKEKPEFKLYVVGDNMLSWANIDPNWMFENKKPSVNPHNEKVAEAMKNSGCHIPIEDMRFDIQVIINSVYNYIDGVNNKDSLLSKTKDFDKKYNGDNHCADIDVSDILTGVNKP